MRLFRSSGGRRGAADVGEVLVSEGVVSEAQLAEARRADGVDSGEALVNLGYANHKDVARVRAHLAGVEYVALSEADVDRATLGIVGEDVLMEHRAMPLRIEDGRLLVALSEPGDARAREALSVSAGQPVKAVAAPADAIRGLQERFFEGAASRRGAPDAPERQVSRERSGRGSGRRGDPEKSGRIGRILVEDGVISESQLREALEVRERDGRKLGEILVSLGHLEARDLACALARRLKLDCVSLAEEEPDPEALGLVDEKTLRKYGAVPLRVEDGRLVVAMSDPNDLYALEDLRVVAGRPITPVVAPEGEVVPALERLFGEGAGGEPVPGRVRLKVLIAEDDVVSRTVATRSVEKLGHETIAVEDGERAWEVYQAHPDIDVVLSDRMMPVMDGIELCRRVRALEREGLMLFIFLTAMGGEEHLLEGMQAGADEYLTKPLNVELLKAKLDDAARLKAVRDHLEPAPPADGAARQEASAEPDGKPGAPRSRGAASGQVWDVLLSQGKLTEEQIQRALEIQKTDRRELGRVLVSLGYIGNRDLAQAQARRLRIDYLELTENDVDRGTLGLVEQKVLRRYGAVPLRVQDGRLVVAMSDPTNIYALEDLRMISGRPVAPVVASEEDIRRVQARLFAITEEVSEFLEEAGREATDGDLDEIALGEHAPDEAPIIRLVGSILQQAVGNGASDIHVEPRAREVVVRMRVDGVLREVMSIPPKLQSGVIARLKIVANLDIAERRVPQDGRFSVRLGGQKLDLRVASLPTVYGEKVVLRLLDTASATVELTRLGFAPKVYERYEGIFRRPYGTVLVTGPTGSGKSTTLYATLNELNTPERNIITVEDPVEYRMNGINQIQTNPRAGLTFASALRSILRADPDVLMVGEIRDRETAKIAVEAALTGHLVLATLHTNNAPGALNRLKDMGVEPYLTASAVDCVIAQRLARRLCENCKEPVEVGSGPVPVRGFPPELLPEEPRFHQAVGCDRCGGSGYRGRIGVYELMVVSEAIREMILRRDPTAEISHAAEEEGMIRLREDGLLKAAAGITTVEEVLRTVV